MKSLDWNETMRRASAMSSAQLAFAITDCHKAALAAEALDRAGALPYGAKTGGYYMDEISVYRAEQARRAKGAK